MATVVDITPSVTTTCCQHRHWTPSGWRRCTHRAVDYGLCARHLLAWISCAGTRSEQQAA